MGLAKCKLGRRRVAVFENGDGVDREVPRIEHEHARLRVEAPNAQHGESAKLTAFEIDVEVERKMFGDEGFGIGERKVVTPGIVIVDRRVVRRTGRERKQGKHGDQSLHVGLDEVGKAPILLQ